MLGTSFKSDWWNGSISSAISSPRSAAYAPSAQMSGPRRPLLRRRDHLALPDVLAENQKQVVRPELTGHVQVRADPLDMKPLHARVEVDQADGHARDADDGQAGAAHIRR